VALPVRRNHDSAITASAHQRRWSSSLAVMRIWTIVPKHESPSMMTRQTRFDLII
jgi:hypothetical protein